jgi:flagellar M-ring protein FliF
VADFVLLDQIKSFTERLSKVQKIIISSVVGLLVIGTLALVFTKSESKKEILFANLDSKDAAKIVEKLKEKNIEYELKDNGNTILVDKDKVYDTRLDMVNQGLPESSEVGYELFDKTNLGMSEFVQKLNYRRALEGELARTINAIDEIKKARVHLVIPEKALFAKDQKTPTASVIVHLKNNKNITKNSVEGIQKLVGGSVEGLVPQAVVIMDGKGKILSEAPIDETSVAGLTDAQHEQQRKVEQHLANKVQTLLDGVLGVGNSMVRVNTELDFNRIEQNRTDYDPERQVVRSEQNINENNQTADSLSYPYVNMAKDVKNNIANYEISKLEERVVKSVGDIKKLSVSVMINGTTKIIDGKEGVKSLQYIPRTADEMRKFEEIVKNAVGFTNSNERKDQITVQNVPFDDPSQQELIDEFQKKPWYQQPDNQKLLFLLGAILFTIILIVLLLQSKYVKERVRIALSLPETVLVEEEEEDEDTEEQLEEIMFDEDELLLLPSDLPEQLLLEGDKEDRELQEAAELEGGGLFDRDTLASTAKADLIDDIDITEESLMKLEIKNKVERFVDEHTPEAIKIIRMLIQQDIDPKNFKF